MAAASDNHTRLLEEGLRASSKREYSDWEQPSFFDIVCWLRPRPTRVVLSSVVTDWTIASPCRRPRWRRLSRGCHDTECANRHLSATYLAPACARPPVPEPCRPCRHACPYPSDGCIVRRRAAWAAKFGMGEPEERIVSPFTHLPGEVSAGHTGRSAMSDAPWPPTTPAGRITRQAGKRPRAVARPRCGSAAPSRRAAPSRPTVLSPASHA
jgi:hypothetical protein